MTGPERFLSPRRVEPPADEALDCECGLAGGHPGQHKWRPRRVEPKPAPSGGVNFYITSCVHGVDLRFTPRCYLCKPVGDLDILPTSAGAYEQGKLAARADTAALVKAARLLSTRAQPRSELGDRCYIVHGDEMRALRAALEATDADNR